MVLPAHLTKPSSCAGCPLEKVGRGFVRPSGSPASPIVFFGESPGAKEVDSGVPFSGPAGGMFGHILYRLGRQREGLRVHNLISCSPPGDKLEGMGWREEVIAHCAPNRAPVLEEGHLVVVALGAVPARHLLGLPDASIKDLHGTVSRREFAGRQAWVVPTFHPSHLVRGAHNLTGTVAYDLNRAFEIADSGGWEEDHPTLHCDPSPEFFQIWVRTYLEAQRADPEGIWLSVDVETPDKEAGQDEGELKSSVDRSMRIIRINFSYHPDEGLTVPFLEPYVSIMKPMLEAPGAVQNYWNKSYDLKRLRPIFALRGHQLDWMDAWKALHSDTPRGLGFVAPFYSRWGPWKHLSGSDPVLYAAGDGVQTQRCAFGIAADLHSKGQWDVFWRHMHEFGIYATTPSVELGLMVDRKVLEGWEEEVPDSPRDADGKPATRHVPGMREQLAEKSLELFHQMQGTVADQLKPLHPRGGWTRRPEGDTFEFEGKLRPIIEKTEEKPTKLCVTCGAQQITVKHRCKDKALVPLVENRILPVSRYYIQEDFNPGSWQQVLAYIKASKHTPGREKGKETTNRETIERLADGKPTSKADATRRDLYHHLLDYRDIKKVLGTYVEGTLRRLALDREAGIADDRLHPTVTNNPSTLRTAMSDPNLQNVVADRRGAESLSAGFRRAVVAQAGCKLVELDWSSIEAVITGWCMGDPRFIKKAWTGIHDHLTAEVAGKPIPEGAPLDETLRLLAEIKEREDRPGGLRDPIKRTIHGTHYLLSPFGMAKRFRKLFPSQQLAEDLQKRYYAFAGGLAHWQATTQDLAYRQEYLGGAGVHPFAYRHEFYNVREYKGITEAQAMRYQRLRREGRRVPGITHMNGRWYSVQAGEDAKRTVAFYPQSIAGGVIRETSLLLFKPEEAQRLFGPEADWYIGEAFYGRTPLRAIIHDSFLLEVPDELIEWVVARVAACMTRMIPQLPCPEAWGLGPALQFGVAVKVGQNWAETKKMKVPQPWLEVLRGNAGAPPQAAEGIELDSVMDEDLDSEDLGEEMYAIV